MRFSTILVGVQLVASPAAALFNNKKKEEVPAAHARLSSCNRTHSSQVCLSLCLWQERAMEMQAADDVQLGFEGIRAVRLLGLGRPY